jgi:cytochrome c oxidase subunit 2
MEVSGMLRRFSIGSLFCLIVVSAAFTVSAQTDPPAPGTVEIQVTAKRFEFEPRVINVQKGQHVRLVVTSADGTHGFALPEYHIDETIKGHTTQVIEFTAERSGRFAFHCSIECGDGHDEMIGTLVVTDAVAQSLPVQFDDKTPGVVIVESGGAHWRIDTANKTVTRVDEPAAAVVEDTPIDRKPPPTGQDRVPHGYEPYDYHLINVPTPKPIVKGSLNLFFTHRFSEPLRPIRDTADTLLGLDSFAVSSLGLTYGITDRLYISAYRSPLCQRGLCRTIEIGLGYHLLDEAGKSPVALSAYASIEGNDNFTEEYTYNLQAMLGRSVTKYVHVFFSPALHLNANGQHRFNPVPTNFFPPALVANSFHLPKNAASFGFGINIGIRPSWSVNFEYTPRIGFKLGRVIPTFNNFGQVTGFFNTSIAEIGFGLEKRIGRHSFALTFSNTQTTTTSRYNSSNLVLPHNKFIIGFNVYRRFLQ